MMTTTHLGALYVGRLLIGVANGFLMTFSQLWLQECSPARYRGFVVGAFTTAISIGRSTSEIHSNALANANTTQAPSLVQ